MTIPTTNLHKGRVVDQISTNLIGLQNDIRSNAQTHKAMSEAQSTDVAVLQSYIGDCVNQYLRRLKWVTDLLDDQERKARLLDALATYGWSADDIVEVLAPIQIAVTALRDAPRTTYAEVVTACDAVIAAVGAPDSLWPE